MSTWKRVLVAGALLILFMALSTPVVYWLFLPTIRSGEDPSLWFFAMFFFGYVAAMILVMQWITILVFHYPGVGKPGPCETIRAQLRAAARSLPDVRVRESARGMTLAYTYMDQDSYGDVTTFTAKETFTVRVRFNERRAECVVTNTLVRRHKTALSLFGVGLWSWSIHRGAIQDVQYDKLLGFDALLRRDVPERYHWNTDELQGAVIAAIVQNGWGVRFSLF